MPDSTVRSGAVRAASLVVRMLPAMAITLGLVGIAAATTTVATVGSAMLVGCALVLELGGWGVATRAHASALGVAAIVGAVVCALGFAGFALVDGEPSTAEPASSPARDGVARR
jgi:hypothetical protein